jgi:hypothetical protein
LMYTPLPSKRVARVCRRAAGESFASVDEQPPPPRARLPLFLEPAVELTATHPDAASDPDRGNLPFGDQLIGSAASDPQNLRHLRDLQVLALLVHIHLRLAFKSTSILVRPARLRYRKSEDRGFPGTGTHEGEHIEIGERPGSDLPPRPKDIEVAKRISPTGRAEEPSPLSLDSVVLPMIGGDRRSVRLTKRARGSSNGDKALPSCFKRTRIGASQSVSRRSHRSTDRTRSLREV